MMQGHASPGGHFANDASAELDLVMEAPPSPSHNSNPGVSLEFQEIAHTHSTAGTQDSFRDSASLLHPDSTRGSIGGSSSLPPPAGSSSSAPVLGGGSSSVPNPNASFYQLAYYQCYFNVDTSQILDRLWRAWQPWRGKFYRELAADVEGAGVGGTVEQADVYGPFWICTTLIFLLAAAGNFANYIDYAIHNSTSSESPSANEGEGAGGLTEPGVWTYDFQKVTIGASVFYAWISIVPLCVWCFLRRAASTVPASAGDVVDGSGSLSPDVVPQHGLVEIASYFGYALVPLLPVCLICIPPIALLRWIAVGVASLLSSAFLLINLGTVDVNNKTLLPVIVAVLILNLAVGLLTKLYFFDF